MISVEGRLVPPPAWISTSWNAKDEAKFEEAKREYAKYREFQGVDKTGQLALKARKRHAEWRDDSQNAVKLYRACLALGTAKECDPVFAKSEESTRIWRDLEAGYDILVNPPRSYTFIRMGYRMSAGDGDRHIYGELPNRLLEENPADRSVIAAAVRESWAELPGYGGPVQPGKGVEFEELILKSIAALKKSKSWRPWDDWLEADLLKTRYARTKDRKCAERALELYERAIDRLPKEFDSKWLTDVRDRTKKELGKG